MVFTWAAGAPRSEHWELSTGAHVRVFGSEAAMLTSWQAFFDEADPDAIPLFQVSDHASRMHPWQAPLNPGQGAGSNQLNGLPIAATPCTAAQPPAHSTPLMRGHAGRSLDFQQQTASMSLP